MKIVVIGGGPAGMMAAITCAKQGDQVTLLEKMDQLGRKLLITGKGRCNITSSLENMDDFIKNTPGNGRFLYSCFQTYTNKDIIDFLHRHGVKTKVERGNRFFPVSDRSLDVLNAFVEELKTLKVEIKVHTKVDEILTEKGRVIGVRIQGNKIQADKVILAAGGKSYPATGSTGDGYELARRLGHSITPIKPSLVPFEVDKESLVLCKQMQGLGLKNVGMKLIDCEKNKVIYEDFGELLFTHFGVSGPTVLSSSAHLLRYKNVEELLKQGKVQLVIDLKPALDCEKLDMRIQRDFEEEKNKQFKNSLDGLFPKKLIEPVIQRSGILPDKKVNEVTKKEREELINVMKRFIFTLKGFRPIEEAIVTSGGIQVKEINPKTMESKIVSGLFLAGEVIDVDAYTGGFNLQIAYSTGVAAGRKEE